MRRPSYKREVRKSGPRKLRAGLDARPAIRYYLHGDEGAGEAAGLYFCRCCDLFLPPAHFTDEGGAHTAAHHVRATVIGLRVLKEHADPANANRFQKVAVRPNDARNVFRILPARAVGVRRNAG